VTKPNRLAIVVMQCLIKMFLTHTFLPKLALKVNYDTRKMSIV